MREKPKILHTEEVARSRLFRVEGLDLRFSNGVERRYERLAGSGRGSVLIVAVPDPDTVLLVREYAAGVERYELGFPKGLVEAGETALEAAGREIQEELGYGARRLEHLARLTLAPGYIAHASDVVLARELYPSRLEGDEPEPIEVVPWSLRRLGELLRREDFTEARSMAALFLVKELLDEGS